MKKLIGGAMLVLLLGAGCTATTPVATNSGHPTAGNQPATALKFSEQPYYSSSYLISGPTLSADAKTALTGFSVTTKANPDGTTEYDLKALEAGYRDQSYALKPGEQLYFIENFLGDDDPATSADRGLADDQAVVVDASGNVVSGPTAWKK